MAQAALRPAVRGPTFIRLLARLAEVDVAAPGQSLPDRLGQWLDWNHALSLAAALDSHPAMPEDTATPLDDLPAECSRARDTLLAAIRNEPLLASDAPPASEPDFAPYRHAYLTRQRAMQAAVGSLRGRLRDALLQSSPSSGTATSPPSRHSRERGNPSCSSTETKMDDRHPPLKSASRFRGNDDDERPRDGAALARLAEVDAVMEVALTPREHTLLAKVPELLAQRFARLHAGGQPHWLDAFRREMQSVLLAELDLRFQPVDALLAALRTHQEFAC
ncbi:DUF3348 family protein [Dyella ginsengisoli]|uniref:DUF3348 family protein n=1 Tax=Dyella ginsengisoli TaxID=363848 RepID=UPI00384B9B6C